MLLALQVHKLFLHLINNFVNTFGKLSVWKWKILLTFLLSSLFSNLIKINITVVVQYFKYIHIDRQHMIHIPSTFKIAKLNFHEFTIKHVFHKIKWNIKYLCLNPIKYLTIGCHLWKCHRQPRYFTTFSYLFYAYGPLLN